VHVLALAIDLHLPASRSLKQKRSLLRPVVDGVRARYPVSIAETGYQDTWQRAQLGIAAVSGSVSIAREIVDDVERFVWSFPDLEVLDARRFWLEEE
jgi:uncharacterized protein YlxP (DUF503 family)